LEFFSSKFPLISHFRVFGYPVVMKHWVANINGQQTRKCMEHGIQGIVIGFPPDQKGYSIYLPGSWTIAVSGDVTFDETFYSALPLHGGDLKMALPSQLFFHT